MYNPMSSLSFVFKHSNVLIRIGLLKLVCLSQAWLFETLIFAKNKDIKRYFRELHTMNMGYNGNTISFFKFI